MRSIYAKLVIMVAAIALLAVGFFEAVVYLSNRESYYASAEEFLKNRAAAAAEYYEAVPPQRRRQDGRAEYHPCLCRRALPHTGGRNRRQGAGRYRRRSGEKPERAAEHNRQALSV